MQEVWRSPQRADGSLFDVVCWGLSRSGWQRITLWTSGGALVVGASLSSGRDGSEGVSARGLSDRQPGVRPRGQPRRPGACPNGFDPRASCRRSCGGSRQQPKLWVRGGTGAKTSAAADDPGRRAMTGGARGMEARDEPRTRSPRCSRAMTLPAATG